jgi:hypothetical protein
MKDTKGHSKDTFKGYPFVGIQGTDIREDTPFGVSPVSFRCLSTPLDERK